MRHGYTPTLPELQAFVAAARAGSSRLSQRLAAGLAFDARRLALARLRICCSNCDKRSGPSLLGPLDHLPLSVDLMRLSQVNHTDKFGRDVTHTQLPSGLTPRNGHDKPLSAESLMAACAAASRAIGTRNGEQET